MCSVDDLDSITVWILALCNVKANLLLTHFGNLKWTHPHGGERESVFRRSEHATALICSAMAAQRGPSEEPGIKVTPLLFALLTSGSSDGVKNAPIAFSKKTGAVFSRTRVEESRKNTCYSAEGVVALVVPPFVGAAARRYAHAVRLAIDRQDFCVM